MLDYGSNVSKLVDLSSCFRDDTDVQVDRMKSGRVSKLLPCLFPYVFACVVQWIGSCDPKCCERGFESRMRLENITIGKHPNGKSIYSPRQPMPN